MWTIHATISFQLLTSFRKDYLMNKTFNLTDLGRNVSIVTIASLFVSNLPIAIGRPVATMPVSSVARCASLAAVLPIGATLAQVKAVLPRGCRISAPGFQATETGFGNYVSASGLVKGQFVFLPKGYLAAHGHYAPSSSIRFHSDDTCDLVNLILSDRPNMSRSYGQQIIHRFSDVFGKPFSEKYIKSNGEDGAGETGWVATWRIQGRKKVTYYQNAGGDFGSILEIVFPFSANQ